MSGFTKGKKTEAAFLEAARQTFAEKGFFNAKISDIARAAGKSPGSFYNYYENKEQLLEALLDEFTQEVVSGSLQNTAKDPYTGVRMAVTAYWNSYNKYLPEMIGLFQMSMTDDGFRARWLQHRAAGITAVLQGLHTAQRGGQATDLNLPVLASALVSMLESFCWTWLASGGDTDIARPDDETAITTLTEVWFRTVYGTPSPTPLPADD